MLLTYALLCILAVGSAFNTTTKHNETTVIEDKNSTAIVGEGNDEKEHHQVQEPQLSSSNDDPQTGNSEELASKGELQLSNQSPNVSSANATVPEEAPHIKGRTKEWGYHVYTEVTKLGNKLYGRHRIGGDNVTVSTPNDKTAPNGSKDGVVHDLPLHASASDHFRKEYGDGHHTGNKYGEKKHGYKNGKSQVNENSGHKKFESDEHGQKDGYHDKEERKSGHVKHQHHHYKNEDNRDKSDEGHHKDNKHAYGYKEYSHTHYYEKDNGYDHGFKSDKGGHDKHGSDHHESKHSKNSKSGDKGHHQKENGASTDESGHHDDYGHKHQGDRYNKDSGHRIKYGADDENHDDHSSKSNSDKGHHDSKHGHKKGHSRTKGYTITTTREYYKKGSSVEDDHKKHENEGSSKESKRGSYDKGHEHHQKDKSKDGQKYGSHEFSEHHHRNHHSDSHHGSNEHGSHRYGDQKSYGGYHDNDEAYDSDGVRPDVSTFGSSAVTHSKPSTTVSKPVLDLPKQPPKIPEIPKPPEYPKYEPEFNKQNHFSGKPGYKGKKPDYSDDEVKRRPYSEKDMDYEHAEKQYPDYLRQHGPKNIGIPHNRPHIIRPGLNPALTTRHRVKGPLTGIEEVDGPLTYSQHYTKRTRLPPRRRRPGGGRSRSHEHKYVPQRSSYPRRGPLLRLKYDPEDKYNPQIQNKWSPVIL